MPYISERQKLNLDRSINNLVQSIDLQIDKDTDVGGILNYTITTLIVRLIKYRYCKVRYWMINMVSGTLSDVSSEFYRRVASKYEDQKIQENGDVGYENIL